MCASCNSATLTGPQCDQCVDATTQFGPLCQPCACPTSRGVCDGGVNGSGNCASCKNDTMFGNLCEPCTCQATNGICNAGVGGDGACSRCTSEAVFGPNCDQNCMCEPTNGVCNSGIAGDGYCRECHGNKVGMQCDRDCDCSPANGICDSGVGGTGWCASCFSDRTFGRYCNGTCRCAAVNGKCNHGPLGDGNCQQCYNVRAYGQQCDSVCGPECGRNRMLQPAPKPLRTATIAAPSRALACHNGPSGAGCTYLFEIREDGSEAKKSFGWISATDLPSNKLFVLSAIAVLIAAYLGGSTAYNADQRIGKIVLAKPHTAWACLCHPLAGILAVTTCVSYQITVAYLALHAFAVNRIEAFETFGATFSWILFGILGLTSAGGRVYGILASAIFYGHKQLDQSDAQRAQDEASLWCDCAWHKWSTRKRALFVNKMQFFLIDLVLAGAVPLVVMLNYNVVTDSLVNTDVDFVKIDASVYRSAITVAVFVGIAVGLPLLCCWCGTSSGSSPSSRTQWWELLNLLVAVIVLSIYGLVEKALNFIRVVELISQLEFPETFVVSITITNIVIGINVIVAIATTLECYGQSAVKYAAKHATKALQGAADSNRQFKDAESVRNASMRNTNNDPTALNVDVDFLDDDDDNDDIGDLPAPTVDEVAQFAESRAEARAQHNVDNEKSRRQSPYANY